MHWSGPLCVKNAHYLVKQRKHFLTGKAGPDFPQEDMECTYTNRGSVQHLTPLGRQSMGLSGWYLDGTESDDKLRVLRECAAIIYSP